MDEVARHVGRIACLDIRQLAEQFTEDGAQLRAGHMSPEAEVQSATAEADVRVGGAAQIETLRMVEASVSQLPDG